MMSDYTTSITNLYHLKLTEKQLQEKQPLLQGRLALRESLSLKKQLQLAGNRLAGTQQKIKGSISKLYADPATDPLLQIEESNPILLLPLRLETRFANSGKELWIRVYPDEIGIHTHETALTASEIKAGRYYWKYLWENHGSDFALHRKKAWSQVANHFGANRATWIFLKTRPLKLPGNDDFSQILTEADLDPGQVETKNQAWSEAAKCYVMPDLLKLRMFIADQLVFETLGNPIVQPLQVSPDPKNTASPKGLNWTGTDLAWLQDFDKAVEVGMAFKIDLSSVPKYDPDTGFSRITVMGIRTLFDQSPLVAPPPAAGAQALSTLFENHQYTPRGLALVPQGTPTNNTEEKKSGYSDLPAFREERYLQDLQQISKIKRPDEMEDGRVLALALGLDPVLFQKLENSRNTDRREAITMNKALYPATLGFFLGHLLHPLFKAEEQDTLRSFFCSYVTGRGPIPVLRVGPQPYGILPTSNFKAFQWYGGDQDFQLFQQLTALLSELDAVYEAGIPHISKLGQPKAPHQLLDEILGLYPNSETFYQRVGYSEDFLRNFLGRPDISSNPNPWLEELITRYSSYIAPKPLPEGILQLKKIVLERTAFRLNRDRLVDVAPASETKTLSIPDAVSPEVHQRHNYIQWLSRLYIRKVNLPLTGIGRDYYLGAELPPPLLYLLLKHGLLIQLYKGVFHWLSTQGLLDPGLSIFHNGDPASDFMASKEYLNFFQGREDLSPMELMLIEIEALNVPVFEPGETAASHFLNHADAITADILNTTPNISPEIIHGFKNLKEFFTSLEYLAKLPTARLERVMVEHLDCLTYRLDAWQTALFYKKLELNRNAGLANGTVLGAYGWLENLKASKVAFMNETDLPPDLQPRTGMPVVKADANGGYIHAPSLTQAKTAALLRNAYLHHHNTADPEMMAINLSSSRVRKALEIFEGIQKGHSMGELLGYRLERHLHDQAEPLDGYIPVLRKEFPLGGKTLSNPGSADQPAATQVNKPAEWVARLDGLAVVNAIKVNKDYPFGLQGLPKPGPEADRIKEGTDDLLDCIDAMKDLMVTESIHQLVQGNTDRAGALLKSIGELKPPARFESVRTPRTPAEILTHRACAIFNPAPANPWPKAAMSQRANTEPGLNDWLGEIIGLPDTIQCTVIETESGEYGTVSIADLNIQPIDLVYLTPPQLDKEESELSRRIAFHYRKTHKISGEIELRIEYDTAEKKYKSMAEILPLLRLLKEIVTNSKALDAADFDLQHDRGKTNFRNLNAETGSLATRKNHLIDALEGLKKKLWNTAGTETPTMCADIRECLIECCDFDLPNAFPKSAAGEEKEIREALRLQAAEVYSQMEKMLASVRNTSPDEEGLTQAFTLFFGHGFKVLPVFHFSNNKEGEVERMAAVYDAYKRENALFSFITGKTNRSRNQLLQNWLDEVVYLRPKLASFEWVRLLYNSFREEQLDLHVMQLPYEPNDSWLGLEFPAHMQVGKGKLSMLVHHFPQGTSPDWSATGFSGLLLDEWMEEIPGKEELTGISFQYNQPDSQPPQALLLAISPTEGANWNWDKLSDILDDTLRRAKQRAIGTGELAKTDWVALLPGALAEFSATKANISLFFRN